MFSAKLWFVKTSTRLIKYKLRVVKSYLVVYFYHYKICQLIKLLDPAPAPWKIYKNVFSETFLRVWIWSGKYLSETLFHVKTMPLPLIRFPLFSRGSKLGGRVGRRIWNIKRRWKYGAGAVLLKRVEGCWHFPYLIFSRLIIFTFRNYYNFMKKFNSIWSIWT